VTNNYTLLATEGLEAVRSVSVNSRWPLNILGDFGRRVLRHVGVLRGWREGDGFITDRSLQVASHVGEVTALPSALSWSHGVCASQTVLIRSSYHSYTIRWQLYVANPLPLMVCRALPNGIKATLLIIQKPIQ
jgi:hypothetical protein